MGDFAYTVLYYTVGGGGDTHVKKFSKNFSGNDPSRGKNMRQSEFDIFKAKNAFLVQGRLVY
jgi:hypothetical protein